MTPIILREGLYMPYSAASVLKYLTYHVVVVVGAACSILEERGIRIHVTIQQAIKNLRSTHLQNSQLNLFWICIHNCVCFKEVRYQK